MAAFLASLALALPSQRDAVVLQASPAAFSGDAAQASPEPEIGHWLDSDCAAVETSYCAHVLERYACPGDPPGTIGYAAEDGSLGFYCCCVARMQPPSTPPPFVAEIACLDSPDFLDAVNQNCNSWVGVPCTEAIGTACGYSSLGVAAVQEACPKTCGLCSESLVMATGDPIFHFGGQWTKLDFPARAGLVKMISFTTRDDDEISVFAATFGRTNSTDSWFGRVDITVNGNTELRAMSSGMNRAGDSMTVRLKNGVLGHSIHNGVGAHNDLHFVKIHNFTVSHHKQAIGNKPLKRLDLEVGGVRLRLSSAPAAKFVMEAKQVRYAHLNIEFPEGLPPVATGPFAELAGLQQISDATKALISSTSKTIDLPEHRAGVMRNGPALATSLIEKDEKGDHVELGTCPMFICNNWTASLDMVGIRSIDYYNKTVHVRYTVKTAGHIRDSQTDTNKGCAFSRIRSMHWTGVSGQGGVAPIAGTIFGDQLRIGFGGLGYDNPSYEFAVEYAPFKGTKYPSDEETAVWNAPDGGMDLVAMGYDAFTNFDGNIDAEFFESFDAAEDKKYDAIYVTGVIHFSGGDDDSAAADSDGNQKPIAGPVARRKAIRDARRNGRAKHLGSQGSQQATQQATQQAAQQASAAAAQQQTSATTQQQQANGEGARDELKRLDAQPERTPPWAEHGETNGTLKDQLEAANAAAEAAAEAAASAAVIQPPGRR